LPAAQVIALPVEEGVRDTALAPEPLDIDQGRLHREPPAEGAVRLVRVDYVLLCPVLVLGDKAVDPGVFLRYHEERPFPRSEPSRRISILSADDFMHPGVPMDLHEPMHPGGGIVGGGMEVRRLWKGLGEERGDGP
jgi:hypothetical protein